MAELWWCCGGDFSFWGIMQLATATANKKKRKK